MTPWNETKDRIGNGYSVTTVPNTEVEAARPRYRNTRKSNTWATNEQIVTAWATTRTINEGAAKLNLPNTTFYGRLISLRKAGVKLTRPMRRSFKPTPQEVVLLNGIIARLTKTQ